MAQTHGVSLIGGDTSSSPDRLFNSVTLLGEGKKGSLLYRRGAQPGDDLYFTGTPLGDSLLGLHLGKNLKGKTSSAEENFLPQRHLDPISRLEEGRDLAQKQVARAMIDLSDGLLSDLKHICEESQVGAAIWVERLSPSRALRSLVPGGPGHAWKWALKGGEGYDFSPPLLRKRLQSSKLWPKNRLAESPASKKSNPWLTESS